MENQILLCLCSCSSAITASSFSLSGTWPGWINPVCAQLSAQACPEVMLERLFLGFLLLLVMLVLAPVLIIFRHYAMLKREVKPPPPPPCEAVWEQICMLFFKTAKTINLWICKNNPTLGLFTFLMKHFLHSNSSCLSLCATAPSLCHMLPAAVNAGFTAARSRRLGSLIYCKINSK